MQRRASDPVRLPETFGRDPLKVGIDRNLSEPIGIGSAVFDALVAHYGSVKALAIELGEADPSQARAEIKAGDFRRFDKHAKPDARAVLATAIHNAYGVLRSPEDEMDYGIAQVFAFLQAFAQYVTSHRRIA